MVTDSVTVTVMETAMEMASSPPDRGYSSALTTELSTP
jgi:hypothetical protein